MTHDIEESFHNVKSELKETHHQLQEGLPETAYENLVDRVNKEVDIATSGITKITRVRKQKLEELDESEKRNDREAPDLFERVSIRVNALHPSGIASDIQTATDFEDFVQNYLRFQRHLRNGPLASKVASRYIMPERVARYMVGKCADAFSQVKEPLEVHAGAVGDHIEELNDLTKSKLGKGLAMFANVASSVAMGAAMSALTGSPFAGRSARKEAASGVGGWVAKKYFGPKIKRRKKKIIQSFEKFSESYQSARKECEKRLKLTALILYGGALRKLESDLNGADQSIAGIEWEEGYIEPQLQQNSVGKYIEWAENTSEDLSELSRSDSWVELADASEVALQYSLKNRSRSKVANPRNGTSYSVEFAHRRAEGILEVADNAWEKGSYKEAALLYLELLTGSPISFDHSEYHSARAGWRLALVGTTSQAPEHLKGFSLGLLPFVQQIAVRKESKGGRYELSGEEIMKESCLVASVLWQFSEEENLEKNINRRIPEDLRQSRATEGPAWKQSSDIDFHEVADKYEIPEDISESSQFAQWISRKRWEKTKRLLLIGGGTVSFIAALAISVYFFLAG